jgi:GNAT superfamily N-acetyltransferase
MPSTYLDSVLGADPDAHDALVVETAGGDLVAIGSAARIPTEGARVVEIGLLVEDRWQQRGIGSGLLDLLAARARRRGVERLRCDVLAGNRHLLAMLRRHTATLAICYEGGVAMVEADLR